MKAMEKKNKNIIQLRAISEKAITDIDLNKRKVTGYFAAFNNIDSHNDMIRRGAFTKSIQERGVNASGNRRIAHLWQHDMQQPIGKLLELYEDEFGLRFVSQIINTQKGNDTLVMYEEGVIREHSIGFNYIADKLEWMPDEEREEGGYWEIKEVKLYEGSSVTFGANENTPFLGVSKSMSFEDKMTKLNESLTANLKIITSGKGSDDLLEGAEYNVKLIQKQITDLLTTPDIKAVQNTLIKEPEQREVNFFTHLINKRKNEF